MAVGNGISLIPWRAQSWSGQQTLSTGDHGEHQFLRVIGGYIGGAGREIRTFPGWKCILNPVDGAPGADGYQDLVIDAQRPCAGPKGPNDALRERVPYSVVSGSYGALANATVDVDETLYVWAEVRHLHSFHRIREKIVLVGETGHRIEPIMDAATKTVISKMSAWERAAGFAVVVLSPDPGALVADAPNQIQVGDCLWIGDIVDANTADAARLARRVHYVTAVSGAPRKVTLATTVAAASTATNLAVQIGRCRGVQSGSGGLGADGRAEYGEEPVNSIMDDDSLTAFFVEDPLDVDAAAPLQKVYPSYVANRQRDFQDLAYVVGGGYRQLEGFQPSTGTWTGSEHFAIPRRRTMELPYRTVPVVSGDRILLAAPGYGCLFQIPVIIPGTSDFGTYPRRGAVANYNDANSRPRSLGVPKGMMAVPNVDQTYHLATGSMAGFPFGTYRIAIAYRDDATGEIGQLSEVWTATNTNGKAYGGLIAAAPVPTTTRIYSTTAVLRVTAGMTITTTAPAEARTVFSVGPDYIDVTGDPFSVAPTAGTYFEVTGSHLQISPMIMHPGYAMCETMALSVMIFMSKVNEEALNHVATVQCNENQAGAFAAGIYQNGYSTSSVYGLPFTEESAGFCAEMFWTYALPTVLASTPTLYNPSIEIPDQRTMPRGASWVRAVRGVRLSGGSIGDTGQKLELMSGIASMVYDSPTGWSNARNELFMWRNDNQLSWYDQWHFIGNRCIPASYAGCKMWSRTLFPHPMETVTLAQVVNAHNPVITASAYSGVGSEGYGRHWWRWRVDEIPHRWDQAREANHQSAYLVMPRGIVQIGEPGYPGIQSGFGMQFVDAPKDEDTVAGGEFRGVALMMTQRHTYAMQWGQGPAGAQPTMVSSEFGCIAPNTVVEHDNATLWLADRGPCEFRGEVAPTGFSLEKWFASTSARFLRDSQGMMRHAWAHYDESRGVVYIGLFENRSGKAINWHGASTTWAAADDKAKSRFPCDTIIVYSIATGAWSEWQPPAGLEVLHAGPITCSDGQQRVAFLAHDNRIYVLDDLFGEDNQEPLTCTAVGGASGETLITVSDSIAASAACGTANSNRGGVGSFIREGMQVCVYDPTSFALKHRSTISVIMSTSPTVQLAMLGAGSWSNGDLVAIGGRSMTIESTFVSPGGPNQTQLGAVTLKASVRSRLTEDASNALVQPAWATAKIRRQTHPSGRHGGGADRSKESTLHAGAFGDLIGVSSSPHVDRTLRMDKGRVDGQSWQVIIEVFGPAQVCLHDILMEVM